MVRKSVLAYLGIPFLVTALLMTIDQQILPPPGTWNLLELHTLDWRFALKNPPRSEAGRDIALIVVDEESYKTINQPLIFYHTYIASVIEYLVRCGVRVIGLDVELPSISLEAKVAGGYESIYSRAFLRARKQGVEVVIGFSSGANPPLALYLAAAGPENLATFALTVDRDDSIRRQQLWFDFGSRRFESFPYLLAKKFAPHKVSPPAPFILIDYSLTGQIPSYSFHEVYRLSREEVKTDNPFKDKVVIIGTLFAFEDRHATPLSRFAPGERRRTAGVVIQATSLATLLGGNFFQEPGILGGGFFIFCVSVAAGLCCYRRRPLSGAVFCVLPAGVVMGAAVVAFQQYYLLRLTPLLAAIMLTYLFTTILHYYQEERQRRRIKERFSAFVPESVIDRLVDLDVNRLMEGEQREVVLMFADIRGFTTYAEQNSREPKKVVAFLNRYHTEMTGIILAHHGTVSQLTGDGIFAFFGAPISLAEPVLEAAKAALEMKDRVAALKEVWQGFGLMELRLGIGLHVGLAVVGTMGSPKKMDYTAIGDNTNIASRIEGLTKEFGEVILMSGEAYQRVADQVVARPLGRAKIRGHSDIELFALDGLRIQ